MRERLSIVQLEIYRAFRALGMSEAKALKAAAAFTRRKDIELAQARLKQFGWLFGASLLAAGLIALAGT